MKPEISFKFRQSIKINFILSEVWKHNNQSINIRLLHTKIINEKIIHEQIVQKSQQKQSL